MNLITNVTCLIDPGPDEGRVTAASAITRFIPYRHLYPMPSALAAERFLTDRNAPIVSLQIGETFAQLR